jgi:hypothetical protein|tara:strand:+ start:1222 stop:1407 length:186 start_codon:yes stop_codon:yes gene_type:complete
MDFKKNSQEYRKNSCRGSQDRNNHIIEMEVVYKKPEVCRVAEPVVYRVAEPGEFVDWTNKW